MLKLNPVQILMSIVLLVFITYNIVEWCQWRSFEQEVSKIPIGVWDYLYNLMD